MSEPSPIACDLTALDTAELEPHKQRAEAVFAAIDDLRELSDGYAFRLPAETDLIAQAGEFIARERRCCPFFHFALEVPAERSPVWLKVTGRDGVKDFIEKTVIPYWNLSK